MHKVLATILVSLLTAVAFGQSGTGKYQPGTIVDVVKHQNLAGEAASDAARYDVTVKVGDTEYVVLYAPPPGANTVEYARGFNLLVLVGEKTLTFNSQLSGTTEVPILRRETTASSDEPDLTMAPSQYFSMKMRHMTNVLALSDDQQAKIKPIVEQETMELTHMWANPSLSPKEKANKLEKVVRTSDQKMKPVLTADQWSKLLEMRKVQRQKVNQWVADQKVAKQS